MQDRELEAFYFFMNTHVDIRRDPLVRRGFLELLPSVLKDARPDSAVEHAIIACSVFFQEAWSAMMPETQRTRKYFAKALRSLNEAVTNSEACQEDGTLMAVVLLEMYEMLSNGLQSQRATGIHQQGAVALVKQRGKLNYKSDVSRRLLVAIRHQLIADADHRGLMLDKEASILSDGTMSSSMPRNPAIDLDTIRIEFVNLKAEMRVASDKSRIFDPDERARDPVREFLTRATQLCRACARWYATLPPTWYPIIVSEPELLPPSVKHAGIYNQSCEVYTDIHIADVINRYRCMHMIGLKWVIQLRSYLSAAVQDAYSPPSFVNEEANARKALQALADGFCDSIPFHLGSKTEAEFFEGHVDFPRLPNDSGQNTANAEAAKAFGGMFLIPPLRSILVALRPDPSISPPLIHGHQWQWLIRQLHRVAAIYHVRAGADQAPNVPSPLFSDIDHSKFEASYQLTSFGEGWDV